MRWSQLMKMKDRVREFSSRYKNGVHPLQEEKSYRFLLNCIYHITKEDLEEKVTYLLKYVDEFEPKTITMVHILGELKYESHPYKIVWNKLMKFLEMDAKQLEEPVIYSLHNRWDERLLQDLINLDFTLHRPYNSPGKLIKGIIHKGGTIIAKKLFIKYPQLTKDEALNSIVFDITFPCDLREIIKLLDEFKVKQAFNSDKTKGSKVSLMIKEKLFDIIERFIDEDDINYTDEHGDNALSLAMKYGLDKKIIMKLLERKVSLLDTRGSVVKSSLKYIANYDEDVYDAFFNVHKRNKFILQQFCDVLFDYRVYQKLTVIERLDRLTNMNIHPSQSVVEYVAYVRKDFRRIEHAINHGHIDLRDYRMDKSTKLFLMACSNDASTSFIGHMLDNKVDVNLVSNWSGDTPLSLACRKNNYSIAKLLIDRRANVNEGKQFNNKPLVALTQHAVEHDADIQKTLSLLLENKADVNCKDDNGITPLCLAKNNSILYNFLVAYGADESAISLTNIDRVKASDVEY